MADNSHSRAGGNPAYADWVRVEIGELADVIAGGTPKAGDPDNFAEPGTGIAWLTPADLSGYEQKYIAHGKRDLSQQGYDSSSAKLMKAGSLLFSSRAPIGYVAIAQNDISTNQGFKNFVFTEHVSPDFAYHYLCSIRELAESLGTGTTFKEISGSTAKTLPFILPPLAEQKVIAEKLDTLLAQVDTTKARLERIPDIIKRFRQSVLAAAVSGKLTEEWRGNVKIDWCQTTLNECSDRIGDGLHGTPNYNDDGEYFFVNGNNLINGSLKIKESTKKVDFEEYSKHKKELGTNTLLLSINGTIGNLALYNGEPVMLGKSACYINLKDTVNRNFGYHLLSSLHFNQYAHEVATGATIKNVPLKGIRNYKFSLPPLEEQTEIVRRVEELFAFADTIEQKAAAALERVNNLTQSILAKAFRGELTAGWRAANPELISGDNSAEALLAKIQAEREALALDKKAVKKPRKKKA
ncbi:restriction endonuclease subunit S [Thalassolituus sp.]|uniref:restriction endonuclease subunit S n=1 Tax=Thalassolituus sp. TaxID=2030822 RepID=UPI003517486C